MRIFGPHRSMKTRHEQPVEALARWTLRTMLSQVAALSWARLMRATFMPARTMSRTSA